jgi:phosphate-selective porin OprO/OprP
MGKTIWLGMGVLMATLLGVPPRAGAESIEQRLERLEKRVEEQDRIIHEQQRQLDERAATPAPATTAPATAAAQPAAPAAPASPDTMRAYWKDGLRFETADKKFQTHVGGRIQIDASNFTESKDMKEEFGSFQNGAELRRARLQVDGLLYGRVDYMIEYDFATGQAEAKDVYLGLIDLPYVGNLRVGHFKEPFSLEEVTSDNYITFMERALPNAFAPSRNMGAMGFNAVLDERMTWALGAFRSSSDAFAQDQEDGGWAGTGRITGLPLWLDDGRSLVHLGTAVSYRDPQGEAERFRSRPEAHQAPDVVDTGNFMADDVARFGGELAAVHGPAWFQGEFIDTLTDGDGPQRNLYGYYVQAGWFLTGENRPYKRETGVFDRVRPRHSFLVDGGPGAWELAARWSSLDLDSGAVRGGQVHDVTVGVNWYLNPNTRVTGNYVFADRIGVGEMNAFLMRFWLYF